MGTMKGQGSATHGLDSPSDEENPSFFSIAEVEEHYLPSARELEALVAHGAGEAGKHIADHSLRLFEEALLES